MPDLTTIISSVTFSSAASVAIIFLAKNLITERLKAAIKDEYDHKLENHKAQLKAVNDVSVEQLKSRLQLAAAERSIRLTRVYERVVDAILGTYKHLIEVRDAVDAYTTIITYTGTPPLNERRAMAGNKLMAMREFYAPLRPLFPKATALQIDELQRQLNRISLDFMMGVEQGGDDRDPGDRPNMDTWKTANDFMMTELPAILELLEDDLRRILETHEGVTSVSTVEAAQA